MSRSLFARLAMRYGPKVTVEDRRAFLKATLAASAGLLLSTRAGAALRVMAGAKRVVVIGGGFGGLACAHELKAAGYDVTVFEARERVGGRVLSFSDYIAGKNVEGGGELIGSNHPTWVAYKEKFNLEFLDVTTEDDLTAPMVVDGKRLSDEEGKKLYEEMEEALKRMDADAANINEDEPWKSDNAQSLDKRTTADWVKSLDVSDFCKRAMAIELQANNGQDLARQSYLGNLAQVKGGGVEKYWTDSEVYRCKGGNQTLAKMLAEAIGPSRVTLGLPVRSIETKGSGMLVTCKDDRTVECDDVVLAVPPTVWNKIDIRVGVPAELSPQMGYNVKYLATVKKRFWKEGKLSQYALGDGDISMTWDGTDAQSDEQDPTSCLTAFSGGPAAQRARARSGEARDAAYADAFEQMYPGFKGNFVRSRFMDWPGDPWAQAGYSFPAPGQVCTHGPIMRKGVGNLHFAGEHTCYKFVGYMEGGLNSGAALAKRLATRDGLAK